MQAQYKNFRTKCTANTANIWLAQFNTVPDSFRMKPSNDVKSEMGNPSNTWLTQPNTTSFNFGINPLNNTKSEMDPSNDAEPKIKKPPKLKWIFIIKEYPQMSNMKIIHPQNLNSFYHKEIGV